MTRWRRIGWGDLDIPAVLANVSEEDKKEMYWADKAINKAYWEWVTPLGKALREKYCK